MVALIMTMTINPPSNAPDLARRDPEVRLNDYCDALRHYLSIPDACIDRILVVDNSGADISRLKAVASRASCGKRLFFESFQGNDHPPLYGKGYGEFRLIDHGLKSAADAGFISGNEVVWKVTGRLRVLNIAELIASMPRESDFYGDFRRFIQPWLDLRVFGFRLNVYDRLLRERFLSMQGDLVGSAETVLYHYLLRMSAQGRAEVTPRFLVHPVIAGVGGRFNNDLLSGADRAKQIVRKYARVAAPWVWI